MSFEFKHIDDYEILIPWDKQREGRDFTALIDKYFPENKDLIFSLLEMVTLSDLDAIGETYLYSTCSKRESKEILNKYKSIVNKVISHCDSSISEYLDWYRRSSYILIKSNNIEFSFPLQIPTWEQEPSSVENQHERSKFGEQIVNKLKDSQIQEYLQYYANILHEEFGLKDFPNYCIVVRPISVLEGEKEVIPLGNLYLHFATLNEKDEGFYMRLINDFLIVWFKRKGVKIIREIKSKTLLDQEKQKDEIKNYLPRFDKLQSQGRKRLSRKLHPAGKSLEDYFDSIFSDEDLRNDYLHKLELLKQYLIPKFIALKEYIKDRTRNKEPRFTDLPAKLNLNGRLFGIQGQTVLSQSFNKDHFIKTLLRREFFKVGFIVFEIDPVIVRNILMDSDNIIHNTQSAEADYTYIWTELFIPWLKSARIDKLRNRVLDSLSQEELKYINECFSALSEYNPAPPNFSLT